MPGCGQARRGQRLALGPRRPPRRRARDALDRHRALEVLVLARARPRRSRRRRSAARAGSGRARAGRRHRRPRVPGGGLRGLVGGPHRLPGSPPGACLLALHVLVRCGERSAAMGILAFRKPEQEQFLSFFDEGDEPTRARARAPARPGARPRPAGAARRRPPDRQTARLRQAVGLGALIVLAFLIVLGFKGCLDSRKDNALKDYNRNVTAVVTDSDQSVGKPFFQRMANGGATRRASRCRSTSCAWPPRTTSSAPRPSPCPATWAPPSATSSSCSTCAPRA